MEKYKDFSFRKQGFTLIELLVVIAIIGILSSVVIASMQSAREKGRDASAKSSMTSIKSAAEGYYDTNNGYGAAGSGTGACTDAEVTRLLTAAGTQTGSTANCLVGVNGATFEADITLNDGTIFCVDSKAFSGTVASVANTDTNADVSCQ